MSSPSSSDHVSSSVPAPTPPSVPPIPPASFYPSIIATTASASAGVASPVPPGAVSAYFPAAAASIPTASSGGNVANGVGGVFLPIIPPSPAPLVIASTSPRLTIPSTRNYAGNYGFRLALESTNCEREKKSSSWTFSINLNRIYCKIGAAVPIKVFNCIIGAHSRLFSLHYRR